MTTASAADDAAMLDQIFDSGRDRGGNSAPPAAEKPAEQAREANPPPAETRQDAPAAQETRQDESDRRLVPLAELKGERQKRQEMEKLLSERDERIRAYEQNLFQIMQRTAQQPAQQQPPPPDPYTDPVGAVSHQVQTLQTEFENRFLNTNRAIAADRFGSDIVKEAEQAAIKAGLAQQFRYSDDPYGHIVKWHKQQKTMAEIGPDPDAWKKSFRDQVRNELLQELKRGGVQQRYPGTLADTTSAGTAVSVQPTDEQMLADIFDSNRPRRAF